MKSTLAVGAQHLRVSHKDFTLYSRQGPSKYPASSTNTNKKIGYVVSDYSELPDTQQNNSAVFVADWRTQYYWYIVFSLEVELAFSVIYPVASW